MVRCLAFFIHHRMKHLAASHIESDNFMIELHHVYHSRQIIKHHVYPQKFAHQDSLYHCAL